MTKNTRTDDDIFKASALSAREQITDWVNVKEKLGTRVGGKFLGWFDVPAKGKFKAQTGVALEDKNDPKKVYGVNLPEYFGAIVTEYKVGDLVGFEYYKDTPAKEAGMSPTKSIRAYNEALKLRKESGHPVEKTEAEAVPTDDSDDFDLLEQPF